MMLLAEGPVAGKTYARFSASLLEILPAVGVDSSCWVVGRTMCQRRGEVGLWPRVGCAMACLVDMEQNPQTSCEKENNKQKMYSATFGKRRSAPVMGVCSGCQMVAWIT